MGLDGGTKITRSDVLRGQSWRMAQQDNSRSTRGGSVNQVFQEKQLDEQCRRTTLWTTCALSGMPLQPPVVADALGQLYNKQAVLEHLLAAKTVAAAAANAPAQPLAMLGAPTDATSSSAGSLVVYSAPQGLVGAAQDLAAACLRYENQQRSAAATSAAGSSGFTPSTFSHIRSLKDVFPVHLTADAAAQHSCTSTARAPGSSASQAAAGSQAGCSTISHSKADLPSPWVCPITFQPCGGKQPSVALRPCGHVLSQKAVAAISPAQPGQHTAATAATEQTSDAGNEASSSNQCCCPVCEAPFDSATDKVLIGGSQQQMDAVRAQLAEAAAAKAKAKQSKRKRADAESREQQRRPAALSNR